MSASTSTSRSGSIKSSRTSASDSPSTSATNDHGRYVLDARLRSVLSDRLGLPLLFALHGNDPGTLSHLARRSQFAAEQRPELFDGILKEAIAEWKKSLKQKEPQLTKILSEIISKESASFNALNELKVKEATKPDGRIDIVLTAAAKNDERESTPLTVIEVGLNGIDWWKKLDQGVKYVERMRIQTQPTKAVRFQEPLLLAVVTIDDELDTESGEFVTRLGVFLCSRKNELEETDEFRMSLLWHSQTTSLMDGSAMFGRLLRVTADFSLWRNENRKDSYEYFSSNCCRVGQHVSGDYILFLLLFLSHSLGNNLTLFILMAGASEL